MFFVGGITMAKKTRKCMRCKLDDTLMEEMEFELVGATKPQKKFYHKACFVEHLKEKEFKRIEAEKLDVLTEKIKEIYGVKEVSKQAFPMLQKLRNGEKVFGNQKNVSKRYKEGYDYLLIAETFDYCSETIEYWNSVKPFDGFMSAFRYAMTIIIDKIYVVEKRARTREAEERKMEVHMKRVQAEEEIFEDTNYKKPSKNKSDFTDFLDE